MLRHATLDRRRRFRYPDGVFFLYFQARLHTTQCEPELAIKSLQRALDLQLEYVQVRGQIRGWGSG